MKIRGLVALASVLVALAVSALTLTGPIYHGHVKYPDGTAAANSQVIVFDPCGALFKVRTDSTGTFHFTLYGHGTNYVLCVTDDINSFSAWWNHVNFRSVGHGYDFGVLVLRPPPHPDHALL